MMRILRSSGKDDVEITKHSTEAKNLSIDARNRKKFFIAVHCGNLRQLKTLISAGADVNIIRFEKLKISTPVMIAVKKNRLSCLKVLIKAGAKPFLYNSEQNIVFPTHLQDVKTLIEAGANPIELITHLQDQECLKFLCKNKIDSVERNKCLMFFSQQFNRVALKALIQAGADVNIADKHGFTAIMMATRYPDNKKARLACVQTLLQAGANVNAANTDGNTALIIAVIIYYTIDYLAALLQAGALCNVQNRNGKTALMFAVKMRNKDCFTELLNHKADVNLQDKDGKTALMYAAEISDLTWCQVLLEHKADVNIQDKEGKNAIMFAVMHENIEVCQFLLRAGANVKKQDKNGRTVLMNAVENMNKSCFKVLLKNKADVNIQDKDGKTALMYAAEIPDLTWCQMLLEHKADVNIQDKEGKNAIMFAIMHENIEVCQFLVHKCDLDMQDKDGWTALHYVCDIYTSNSGLIDIIVNLLLRAEANINKQDKNGRTVLMNAVENMNWNCLEVLLKHKADVNIQDKRGKTALMYSAEIPDMDWCQLLINYKADLNIRDEDNKTALMHAVSSNLFKCARSLILAGADTELKDKSNCSALVHLLKCQKTSVEDFLYFHNTLIFFLKKGVSPAVDPYYRKLFHVLPDVCKPSRLNDYFDSIFYCSRSQDITNHMRKLTIECTIQQRNAEYTRLLVCNGVLHGSFDSRGQPSYISHLHCALDNGSYGVVKYFFANCYLTHKDISDLRHRFKCQTSKVPRLDMSDEEVDMDTIITQAVCQPWPLVKLAFIAVSTTLGPGPDRQNRVTQTQLPDRLQRMLMFQEPVSRLPVGEWEDIPLTFDPVEYETLPKPRPLLYYWPMGRDLVV